MKIDEAEFRENLIKYKDILIQNIFKGEELINIVYLNEYEIEYATYIEVEGVYFSVKFKREEIENEQNLIDIFIDEFKFCGYVEFYPNSKRIALYGRKDQLFIELRKYKLKLLNEYENR